MSVALARRLVWNGIASEEEVDAALYHAAVRGTAFIEALLAALPGLEARLERELARSVAPHHREIEPLFELVDALPRGLCCQLLTIPVRQDPETGVVEAVAADPADHHVAEELAFHLRAPVQLSGAPLRALLNALTHCGQEAPAPGISPSQPPIPLVRLSLEPRPRAVAVGAAPAEDIEEVSPPGTIQGVAPQAFGVTSPRPVFVPPRGQAVEREALAPGSPEPSAESAEEPVLSLTHSKPAPVSGEEEASEGGDPGDLSEAVAELRRAETAEEVSERLVRGLRPMAEAVVVFAIRSDSFQARAAGGSASRTGAVRDLVLPAHAPSVLSCAVQERGYLGPLPVTEAHGELAAWLGQPQGEVAVHVVDVSGRPALLLLLAGFRSAFLATRRAERLSAVASESLERILRGRKRRTAGG